MYSHSNLYFDSKSQHYPNQGSEGLLFVVDSSDVSRIPEAKDEMMRILGDEGMEKGVPVCVLANKQVKIV